MAAPRLPAVRGDVLSGTPRVLPGNGYQLEGTLIGYVRDAPKQERTKLDDADCGTRPLQDAESNGWQAIAEMAGQTADGRRSNTWPTHEGVTALCRAGMDGDMPDTAVTEQHLSAIAVESNGQSALSVVAGQLMEHRKVSMKPTHDGTTALCRAVVDGDARGTASARHQQLSAAGAESNGQATPPRMARQPTEYCQLGIQPSHDGTTALCRAGVSGDMRDTACAEKQCLAVASAESNGQDVSPKMAVIMTEHRRLSMQPAHATFIMNPFRMRILNPNP